MLSVAADQCARCDRYWTSRVKRFEPLLTRLLDGVNQRALLEPLSRNCFTIPAAITL